MFFLIATILLTFVLYVLAYGAGAAKVLKLLAYTLVGAGATAALFLPILLLVDRPDWYTYIVFYLVLLSLPAAITVVDVDRAVPRLSLLGVVFINVLAIQFAEPWSWITWLLNPLRLDGIVGSLVSLWPSCIALLLTVTGPPGDPRLRLVLGVWTQAVGLIWLLPFAVVSLIRFDATDWTSYLVSVVACVAAVHVVLVAYSLFAAIRGKSLSTSQGSESAAQVIAERVYVTKYHPLLLGGLALAWWFAVDAWRTSPVLPNGKIGIAYIVAAVLGMLLMPDRPHRPDRPDRPDRRGEREDLGALMADARSFKWRSYRGTIFMFLSGLVLFWLIGHQEEAGGFIFGTHGLATFVFILSILAGIFVLKGLFTGAWIIAEAAGRPASRTVRRYAWLAGLAAIVFWQAVNLPREHPQGGLDGNEMAFADGRVYLWYATEVGWWHRSGRAVYYEISGDGKQRWRVCGDAGNPVDSFRVITDQGIECRQGEAVRLFDTDGLILSGWPIQTHKIPVQEIAADASACWPVAAEVPKLSCPRVFGALEDAHRIPGTPVPSSWDVDAARYFRYRWDNLPMTECIEVPADAVLPDGTSTDATVLVFHRYHSEPGTFWLLDREASCARARGTVGAYLRGRMFYEWHPDIAPYHGETRTELF